MLSALSRLRFYAFRIRFAILASHQSRTFNAYFQCSGSHMVKVERLFCARIVRVKSQKGRRRRRRYHHDINRAFLLLRRISRRYKFVHQPRRVDRLALVVASLISSSNKHSDKVSADCIGEIASAAALWCPRGSCGCVCVGFSSF